jgi:hypothetical protein
MTPKMIYQTLLKRLVQILHGKIGRNNDNSPQDGVCNSVPQQSRYFRDLKRYGRGCNRDYRPALFFKSISYS